MTLWYVLCVYLFNGANLAAAVAAAITVFSSSLVKNGMHVVDMGYGGHGSVTSYQFLWSALSAGDIKSARKGCVL